VIFVGLKSQQLAAAAAHMVGLLKQGGSIILGQNGLPYWYFEKLDSPLRGSRLAACASSLRPSAPWLPTRRSCRSTSWISRSSDFWRFGIQSDHPRPLLSKGSVAPAFAR